MSSLVLISIVLIRKVYNLFNLAVFAIKAKVIKTSKKGFIINLKHLLKEHN